MLEAQVRQAVTRTPKRLLVYMTDGTLNPYNVHKAYIWQGLLVLFSDEDNIRGVINMHQVERIEVKDQ